MSKQFYEKVAVIQQKLKAPKNQYNSFGGYHYRNCEDILEAVKPMLGDLVLKLDDEAVEVGNRVYIKAIATITDGENSIVNSALAREAENKKGMDDSQITGAASSYARKYALNGLFLIDDTKDADTEQSKNVKAPAKKGASKKAKAPAKETKANKDLEESNFRKNAGKSATPTVQEDDDL